MVKSIPGKRIGRPFVQNTAFKIILTERFKESRDKCIDYILSTFMNRFAAKSLYVDIERAINILSESALSYSICDNKKLAQRNVRKIHLKKHKYKIFYRVEEHTVYVDVILHDKQDFENILK